MGEIDTVKLVAYSVFLTVVILLADIGVFALLQHSGLDYDMRVLVFTLALFVMMFGVAGIMVNGVEKT